MHIGGLPNAYRRFAKCISEKRCGQEGGRCSIVRYVAQIPRASGRMFAHWVYLICSDLLLDGQWMNSFLGSRRGRK
jgi:hypothetical protein